jgi:CBS domain-containing protein
MRISDVVKRKGGSVVTVRSDATVSELLALLSEHRIGAVVVSDDGEAVHGIVSERDVVRHLHSLEHLEGQMTEHRIRHVPVVSDGRLTAIVSIGDVVKNRIDDLQSERDQLRDYISQ